MKEIILFFVLLVTKFFKHEDSLKNHILNVHDRKKPFKCEVCQQAKFGRNSELEKHISRVHDNPKRCSICNLDFSKRNLLRNHVASVHEDKILFNCEICKMEFATKKYLSRHISDVHKENKKLKEGIEVKTEQVQVFIEKSKFVELKSESIHNNELNKSPAVQIKTEIMNLEKESSQNGDLILGV